MFTHPVKQSTTGQNIGFGKVILFGEHFVVYGADAIVGAVSEYTNCHVEITPGKSGVEVIDNRPAVPGYIVEKRAEQEKAHQLVFDHLKVDTSTSDGLRITIGGPLVPSSGIGASASDVVALSRALSDLYGLNLTEDEVNQSAFIGEGGYHGTPSGVDNTAATFGGLIAYRRTDGKSVFNPIPFNSPLYVVVVGTGITASTTKVVGDVRVLKEAKPEFFADVMARYGAVEREAMAALKAGDIAAVGALMNKTHALCREIDISCDALEQIVACALENGALGAKLSGTGRGGIAVALTRDPAHRDELAAALQAKCPAAKFIWKYTITPKGEDASL